MLAARDLRSTFFVVGEALREHRALAERAHAEGHWIGNHTLTHPRPLGESGVEVCEIEAAQAELRELAHPDRLFRPSGAGGELEPGLLSAAAVEALVAGRFTCVLWNAVPGDWTDPGWVETALAQIAAQDWTLLVLHDVGGRLRGPPRRVLDARGRGDRPGLPARLRPDPARRGHRNARRLALWR